MKTVTMYRWRYYDDVRRKWVRTTYALTDAEAAERLPPGAERLDCTAETRTIYETLQEQAEAIGNRHAKLHRLPGEPRSKG